MSASNGVRVASPDDTLEVALSLAAAGWPVFPVHVRELPDGKRTKVPAIKGWTEGAASTDPETIATWWGADLPGAWVGVWAKGAGIVVVDLDLDKGQGSGKANLKAAGTKLPETLAYKTPSGGRHLVYEAPKGDWTIAQGVPVPGVDIRAGNGLIVYYGPVLTGAPKLAQAPEWALVPAKAKGAATKHDVGVEAWLSAVREGKPTAEVKAARKAVTPDIKHDPMLEAVNTLVALGTGGAPGVASALARARAVYIAGRPDRARDWDNALAGSVKHYGLPPVTLPLTKAERKALRNGLVPNEQKARAKAKEAAATEVADRPLYVDVASILAGDMTSPKPDAGAVRADGERMLYLGKVNGLVGESEAGKTLIATTMVADELHHGGRCLWLDVDHNGAPATLGRLVAAGVPVEVLSDPVRFRLVVPEDRAAIAAAIADAANWRPTVAVVDSVGEVVPMFGGDSNSADDYSRVHREVFTPLASLGAAVLVIDHLAKTALGTGYASGTGAKKRAMDGAYFGVKLVESFRPGRRRCGRPHHPQGQARRGACHFPQRNRGRVPARLSRWRVVVGVPPRP